MSEIVEPVEQTEQETPRTSESVLNRAVESVIALVNAMGNFADMTRGALGSGDGLSCEVAPSVVESVFMDKNSYIPLTLAINGKHDDLQTLSDTLSIIMDTLARSKTYPTGNGFEIVDIVYGNQPRIIGREPNNKWLMACDVVVKIYRKDEETT